MTERKTKKRILLITYYFPPIQGPRSLRWIQLSRHLVHQGYEIDVLTVNPARGEGNYDETSVREIPEGVRVIRTYPGPLHSFSNQSLPVGVHDVAQQGSISRLQSRCRKVIRTLFKWGLEPLLFPDKNVEWMLWARRELNLLEKNAYDFVISSAMPFTDHLLGYYFHKRTGVSWVMDYGDPWIFNPGARKWRSFIDKQVEGYLLKAASSVVVTTHETKAGFLKHYSFLEESRIAVIPQGYDPKLYAKISAEETLKFRIVYTGIFYEGMREPYQFFEAIRTLQDLDLEVVIAGNITWTFKRWLQRKGLMHRCKLLGQVSHARVVSLQKSADLLLLFGWTNGYQLPGKIFEYFGAERPIFSIFYDSRDLAAQMIRRYRRGVSVLNNVKEIERALKKLYDAKTDDQLDLPFMLDPVEDMTWKHRARALDQVLKSDMEEDRSEVSSMMPIFENTDTKVNVLEEESMK